MVENKYGKIVRDEWHKTAIIRPYAVLDEFVVMPNHVHGIIQLKEHMTVQRGTARRAPLGVTMGTTEQFGKPTVGTIPTIVRSFKSAVAKRIHETTPIFRWQRNYYVHIIRDEKSLFFIRKYIRDNPKNWHFDYEIHFNRENSASAVYSLEVKHG